MFFFTIKNIIINPRFFCNIFISHQSRNFFFQIHRIQIFSIFSKSILRIVIRIIQSSPFNSLHFLTIFWKQSHNPMNYTLKIKPKFRSVPIILMGSHIITNQRIITSRKPPNRLFQKFLTNWGTRNIFITQKFCRTIRLRKNLFCFRRPTSSINRIPNFLRCQTFPSNIYSFKPFKLFASSSLTKINLKLIIQNSLFFIILQIRKIPQIMRKISVHITTNGNRPLLPIQNFKPAILPNNPIHRIQRKSLTNCIHNRLLLTIIITKFPLIRRPNIQTPIITSYAALVIVFVILNQISNRN